MARKPRLRTLSIFLLREEIGSWDDALRDGEGVSRHETRKAVDVDGLLVVGSPNRKPPWWRDYVSPYVLRSGELDRLINASTGALFFFEAADRRFALALGQGRHLLEPEAFEHDFGLRVVLNSVDADRIRSVDARTIDERTMHTRRNASRESDFEDFGLDVARDLVRAVSGPPRDENLARNLAGADRLAVSCRAQMEDLPDLASQLLAAYESEDYRERFPWVDKLRPVKDAALKYELNDQLADDLKDRQLDNLHLAPPEVVDPLRLAGFAYSTLRGEELDTDPRISVYLQSLSEKQELSVDRLKSDRIVAFEAEGEQMLDSWSIYKCIVYETERDDYLYVLSGGDWFRVSSDFQQETIDLVEEMTPLNLDLPEAPAGIEEKDYNQLAAEQCGCLNLDRELVYVAGRSGIELCDLLSQNRQLIHVKRRGYSSTLSHLFAQGAVAAQLMLGDQPFRTASRELVDRIDSSFTAVLPDGRPRPDDYEIGYVVITRATPQNDNPYTLPFFSLVNLCSTVRSLQAFGIRVSIAEVRETA